MSKNKSKQKLKKTQAEAIDISSAIDGFLNRIIYRFQFFVLLITKRIGLLFEYIWLALVDIGGGNTTKEKFHKKTKVESQNSRKIKENLKMSIAHPKILSKRFEFQLIVQLFFEEDLVAVMGNLRKNFKNQDFSEYQYSTNVVVGQKIKIDLSSPDFDLSKPAVKLMSKSVNKFIFLGKPKDNCEPGYHKILLSIIDENTGLEIEALTINVRVVDFAFDHIPRPVISKTLSSILGVGSTIIFLLTFLEQVDKTFGYASGTAAGTLAAFLYLNFYSAYKKVRLNNN